METPASEWMPSEDDQHDHPLRCGFSRARRLVLAVAAAAILAPGLLAAAPTQAVTTQAVTTQAAATRAAPASAAPAVSGATVPDPTGGMLIQLKNMKSGLCLSIAGGGTNSNDRAVQYNCDLDFSRLWLVTDQTTLGGYQVYHIRNSKSDLCLTIAGGNWNAGTGLNNNDTAVQYNCDTDPARYWALNDPTLIRQYQLYNWNSGKCLTIAGAGTNNNDTAVQYNCDTDPSRHWVLINPNAPRCSNLPCRYRKSPGVP